MRIISGKAGRTAIKVPGDVARPTTDFVRQAMFSILGDYVKDANVLDLFAGSGALGLESLSRGAASCTFIDAHRNAVKVIQENLKTTKLLGSVKCSDVETWLKRDTQQYDLIFADPPYAHSPSDKELIGQLFTQENLALRLKPAGIFYAEISKLTESPAHPQWRLLDRREYGSSAILLYKLVVNE